MCEYHCDCSLSTNDKVKSRVRATVHTNSFIRGHFPLEILQAHKVSSVMQYDRRRSPHGICLLSGKLLSIYFQTGKGGR